MSILDGSFAEQLTDALASADIPQSAVVVRMLPGGGPPWDPGPPVADPHACKGWVDDYSLEERAVSSVPVSDRRIYILSNTLDIAPAIGMTVQVAGGLVHTIISIRRDPAGATWELQARV